MDIRMICIGDELLSGDTLNTDLSFIGQALAEHGMSLHDEVCVPDDLGAIRQALQAADSADVILISGGLGPTCDDLTRKAVADFLGLPLFIHSGIRKGLEQKLFHHLSNLPADYLDKQAEFIESANPLPNGAGVAPGLELEHGQAHWFLLPGPPRELQPMFHESVLPRLLVLSHQECASLTRRVIGLGEPQVEAMALDVISALRDEVHFAICIKEDCIRLHLTAPCQKAPLLDAIDGRLEQAFGANLLPKECTSAAHYLGILLKRHHLMMATAESCTGGGVAAAMTAVPGSSEWFVGGIVTYANEWKQDVLGVRGETLSAHGAVSQETVHEMLDGLQGRFGVQAGTAISGIAGPGGATPDKPVGTVVIGAYTPGWRYVHTFHFSGNREDVRRQSVYTAIALLIRALQETAAS